MTSGYRVVCSDGEIRHDSLFQSRQDAETWMTWHTGFHACWRHTIRKEAEWEVAAMRIRRRRPLNLPSIRSRELANEGSPAEIAIDLTDDDLASAGDVTVGIGGVPTPASTPTPAPESEHPTQAPIPASYRTVLAQAFGSGQAGTVRDNHREKESNRV